MKKRLRKFFNLLLIVGWIFLLTVNVNAETVQYQPLSIKEEIQKPQKFINISECSEEFMIKYFEETEELEQNNNKENILIVTSTESIQDTFGASEVVEGPNNQYFLQYDSEEERTYAYEQLKSSTQIISVEENIVHETSVYNSWGVEETGLAYAKEIANNKDLNDITVAIIDTGCDVDLFNSCYPGRLAGSYNVLDTTAEMTDENGHGTHIAGTIAESTPDNVKILPIKVSSTGNMYLSDIIEAINYVVYYDKADVINMSYGSYGYTSSEYNAVESATQENIICVAAAGNDNVADDHYPSAFDNTISIASVDSRLEKSDFSNYGSSITFCAPGSKILSINGIKSGTSMAAPHAASAVAILKSYNEEISLDDTIKLLKENAIDLGDKGYDKYYGYGLINFNDIEFYDGINGDSYNIYQKDDGKDLAVTKIELAEAFSPTYNYGNITNLMNTKINIYYGNVNYATKCLGELVDFEVTGYNPYSYTTQNVTLKYSGRTITFEVDNTNATTAGWEYTVLSDGNISLTTFNYSDIPPVKIYIPEKLDGYTVTTIGDYLFNSITNIKSVVLPDTITEIQEYAFEYCEHLQSIELSQNLEIIANDSISCCYNLFEVDVPSSVKEIGTYAFWGSYNLHKVTLRDGLTDIGNLVFSYTLIDSIYIPKTLEYMGVNPFSYTYSLKTISGSAENENYKVTDNAIIDLSTNSLICTTEVVPVGTEIINRYAFINAAEEVHIPEGVTKIDDWAFINFDYYDFEKIYLPKSLTSIGEYSFYVYLYAYDNYYYPGYLTLYVYSDSEAKAYAEDYGLKYICVDPNEITVNVTKTEYNAFETVDTSDMYVELGYEGGRRETINQNIEIKYNNGNDSFRVGDTYFTVSVYNEYGLLVEKEVNVTVNKAIPQYTVPTNIEAYQWQNLSDAKLPENFVWADGTQELSEKGTKIYKANYLPTDTTNYQTVENIEITVNVKPVELPFEDIYESDWFYPAIEFVYGKGYILGTSPTTFEPRTKLTRGMIVTILFRIEGANKVTNEVEFPDVKSTEYYYEAVRWAKTNGVVNGYQDGYFRPDNYITREELACILMNYSKFKNENVELTADLSTFNDGDTVSDFAQSAMEWAVARGVITGYTDNNTLRPQGTTTRDVAAVMICKYFTNNKQQ